VLQAAQCKIDRVSTVQRTQRRRTGSKRCQRLRCQLR
jgi:hypothetical protein